MVSDANLYTENGYGKLVKTTATTTKCLESRLYEDVSETTNGRSSIEKWKAKLWNPEAPLLVLTTNLISTALPAVWNEHNS